MNAYLLLVFFYLISFLYNQLYIDTILQIHFLNPMAKFSQNYLLQLFSHQVKSNHRTIFILIGEGSKYQIPSLQEKLSTVSNMNNIIWFYKNTETYMDRESKKVKMSEEDSEFHKWVKTQDPDYISYKENSKVLGRTCDMLILQDFEALTPNMMACSMETVRGGGAIVLLLDREKSINEIINKRSDLIDQMGCSDKLVSRFNRRIFKSLSHFGCATFLDSKLKIMDITSEYTFPNPGQSQNTFKNDDCKPLLSLCKTKDQYEVLKGLMDLSDDQNDSFIASIIASRGRGKSVALGLSIANALDKSSPMVAISALFLENVQEIFTSIINGLNNLGYRKMTDYKIIYSFEGKKRLIRKIEITKNGKKFAEYVHPIDEIKFYPSLIVIDEAASIPLPQLKKLLNCQKVFMATTVNGYEGTGRVFRTKLSEYLREKNYKCHEFQMSEPIRYSLADPVEDWLGKSLLLEPKIQNFQNCPLPSDCSIFYINKDALFSGNPKTEEFLTEVFSLFVSSHYRNSPNDIQILSDSPNHEIFVLLTPESKVVCAIQIAIEGNCNQLSENKEGNLIPWVIYDNYCEFKDSEIFISNLGIRIVRIAVHPSLLSMGYGSQAVSFLINSIESSTPDANHSTPSIRFKDNNVLLHPLPKIIFPKISWIGSSFGITEKLLNFWKKLGFSSLCIKQTPSKTTGEFSTVLCRSLNKQLEQELNLFESHFLQRFICLLPNVFRNLSPTLVLSLIYSSKSKVVGKTINFTEDERLRLNKFARGSLDIRGVLDVLPDFSKLFFYHRDVNGMNLISQTALITIGCQCKSIEEACEFLGLESFKLTGNLANNIKNYLNLK